MDEKNVTLSVPAEADFARSVRMTASTLAVCCDMSVEDVEDVRMIAEEGFVYSCATAPERVGVSFSLTGDAMTMDFTLGDAEPADESIELVEVPALRRVRRLLRLRGRTRAASRQAGGGRPCRLTVPPSGPQRVRSAGPPAARPHGTRTARGSSSAASRSRATPRRATS